MATITEATTWGEMKPGDVFPNGKHIVSEVIPGVSTTNGEPIVTVNFMYPSPHDTDKMIGSSYGSNWADETWGDAVARSEFMHNLTDHS